MSIETMLEQIRTLPVSERKRLIGLIVDTLTDADASPDEDRLTREPMHGIDAYRRMPWHEFVERTAGILADDPIERPAQPPLEAREPLE
jgi:hypothetical protein